MRRSWPAIAMIASLFGLASPASATVMVEVSLEDMIRSSDAIVLGVVERSGTRVAMHGGSLRPETITTIRVREWIAGSGEPTVELREIGGQWQGGGLRIDGTPEYRIGELVVVFLERRSEAPNDLRTFAMVQGKFTVRAGVPGTPDLVQRDLSGIAFAHWADGRQTVRDAPPQPAMILADFLSYVRQVRFGNVDAASSSALGGGQ